MKFNQQEDGSCDLIFSDEEIKVISKHKKLYFTAEFLRHFSNSLMRMSVEFNERFDEKSPAVFIILIWKKKSRTYS